MHVLFFISTLSSGGAERVTTTLANYWAQKGWQVTLVTLSGLERDFYSLDPKIERIALELDQQSPRMFAALSNNVRRILALRRVLRKIKPDVAVAMMATANSLLALAGIFSNVSTVGSERIHPPTLPLARPWETIRQWSYPRLDALIAQTEQSAAWLRQHMSLKEVAVIPNPVNYPIPAHEPRVLPETILKETHARHLLLAIGRLTYQKGFDRLISAFAEAAAHHPEWVLVILGEGPLKDTLERKAREACIKVRLPGAVGNVSEWLEAADLYALTSRFEGFPNTLLEAMAHGVPTVAVDCTTGPREILHHEVDGLLVPQDDDAALARAIDRLMRDESLRNRLSKNAVKAREKFAVERVAHLWEELFIKVCG